eukprot:gene11405-13258_t
MLRLRAVVMYVTGEKVAPVTTIFVGGNHEASNVLQSLYYGGWVAPKIYFLGFAGVVNFRGLRIAGLSGIFNQKHYRAGHFETPPYTEDTLRSVYHMRELEVFRMAHLVQSDHPVDVFLSHDWPAGIWDFGNRERLLKVKPYFREDMQSGKLGNPPLMHLLHSIKPSYWFAAHLHVKFAATVVHPPDFDATLQLQPPPPPQPAQLPPQAQVEGSTPGGFRPPPPSQPMPEKEINETQDNASTQSSSNNSELGKRSATDHVGHSNNSESLAYTVNPRVTQFLALDKVLPGREFLHFLQMPVQASAGPFHSEELEFDPEWLAILSRTHTLLQTHRGDVRLPQQVDKISTQEIADVRERLTKFFCSLEIPLIGPYIPPVIISGECIPPSRNLFQGRNNNSASKSAQLSESEQSNISVTAGAKDAPSATESATESDFSGFADVHFTKESYAQQVAMEMEKLQQQELYAAQGLPPPSFAKGSQSNGYPSMSQFDGSGRGAGRAIPQHNQQHSYYGPGGAQQSRQNNQGQVQGRGGGRGGRGGSHKSHNMLFNPTSRVTALGNAQTDALLQALGLKHIWTRPCLDSTSALSENKASVSALPASGRTPAPPSGPPPPQSLKMATGSDAEEVATSESLVQPQAPLSALSLTGPNTSSGSTYAAMDDKYGLQAYYGAGAVYYPAQSSSVVSSSESAAVRGMPLVTSESAADPLEIDIDDDVASAVAEAARPGDPSEIDLEDEEAPAEKAASGEKESDPNAIDLDF